MAAVALLAALLLVPGAFAATGSKSSSYSGYGGEGANVQHPLATGNKPGTLPFTGIDLLYVVLAGGGIVLAGVAIRRLSRP